MKIVLLGIIVAGAILMAGYELVGGGGYTIYRRVTDGVIVRVVDSNGNIVKVSPDEAEKLVGETIRVSPDFK